jgi:hypothetical protein
MAYSKVNWTELIPISAANLATMDDGLHDAHADIASLLSNTIKIVQMQTATIAANLNSTTSTSYVDTTLTKAITPKYADSIILAIAVGEFGGTSANFDLYNSTNTTSLHEWLLNIAAYYPGTLMGTYTVNSTAARTFKVRMKANSDTAYWCRYGPGILVLLEVRP